MAATIQIMNFTATVSGGVWQGPTPAMSAMLNNLEARHREFTPTAAAPDADAASAYAMAREFGGRVLHADPPAGDPGPPGAVYGVGG